MEILMFQRDLCRGIMLSIPNIPATVVRFICDYFTFVHESQFVYQFPVSAAARSTCVMRLDTCAAQVKWTRLPDMPTARFSCSTAITNQCCIVMCDAYYHKQISTTRVDSYDTVAGRWTSLAPLPNVRHAFATVLCGESIYVVGGWNASKAGYMYNPTISRWSLIPAMHTERRYCAAISHDNKIYVMGGQTIDDVQCILASCECFDPNTQTWTSLEAMDAPRCKAPCVVIPDVDDCGSSCIAILGGYIGDRIGVCSSVQLYSVKTNKWRTASWSLPKKLYDSRAQWTARGLIVYGGFDAHCCRSHQCYLLDLQTGMWLALADIPI